MLQHTLCPTTEAYVRFLTATLQSSCVTTQIPLYSQLLQSYALSMRRMRIRLGRVTCPLWRTPIVSVPPRRRDIFSDAGEAVPVRSCSESATGTQMEHADARAC